MAIWLHYLKIYYNISADRINITELSSCVIYECLNRGQKIGKHHTNCNETAGGFFCKSGIIANLIFTIFIDNKWPGVKYLKKKIQEIICIDLL